MDRGVADQSVDLELARPPSRWTVYIIESERGALYTGITTAPERRFREHASGRGARWFRGTAPRRFVYLEPCDDRGSALRREAAIKRLSRAEKLALVAAGLAQAGLAVGEAARSDGAPA